MRSIAWEFVPDVVVPENLLSLRPLFTGRPTLNNPDHTLNQ